MLLILRYLSTLRLSEFFSKMHQSVVDTNTLIARSWSAATVLRTSLLHGLLF